MSEVVTSRVKVYPIDVAKCALIGIASQGYSACTEIAVAALKRIAELEAKK